MSEVLAVVNVVLEEHLLHLEKCLAGEKAVAPGLMLRSDPLHFKLVGKLLQTALQVLARLHQVLDVVHVGKVQLQALKECLLRLGQVLEDKK